ncbi:hypothetical protein [Pedobacter alpinus]|uniref:Lipoprotein n=1 Tax=Pedobacter alpinus TaxID=1590643 RepID=A0ABW5TS80_9SPHI
MKKYILILSAIAFGFTACNQNKPKEASEVLNETNASKECYLATSGKDSSSISFDNKNGEVTGILNFNFLEKDDTNGEIKGSFKGDTLFVDYVFQAEGTTSKNPLVFLKKGDKLQQGYGVIETYLGRTYFKNHAEIKFEDGFLYEPIDCQ